MATPLNTFKTYTANLTTTTANIYTTPSNTVSIILLSQVTNVITSSANVTAYHYDGSSVSTELVKNFTVPPADAVSVLTGKLVLQANQSFQASASANSALKITMSIIESIQ